MTRQARQFIKLVMNAITIKRRLPRGVAPDKRVSLTDRAKYRRSLVLRSFRQLSRGYFASEKDWEFVIETLLFAIIAAVSAWPVFVTAFALKQFLEGLAS